MNILVLLFKGKASFSNNYHFEQRTGDLVSVWYEAVYFETRNYSICRAILVSKFTHEIRSFMTVYQDAIDHLKANDLTIVTLMMMSRPLKITNTRVNEKSGCNVKQVNRTT